MRETPALATQFLCAGNVRRKLRRATTTCVTRVDKPVREKHKIYQGGTMLDVKRRLWWAISHVVGWRLATLILSYEPCAWCSGSTTEHELGCTKGHVGGKE